jgi:hypothetical protein
MAVANRGVIVVLASLTRPDDRSHLCDILEQEIRSYRSSVYVQGRSFPRLRNAITAHVSANPKRAAAFYRSFLGSKEKRERDIAVYGLGELRDSTAIPELVAAMVPEQENSLLPGSVAVALGKIGSEDAYAALVQMVLQEPVVERRVWAAIVVMKEVCGVPAKSPGGSWQNGCLVTVATDRRAAAERFAAAMRTLAERADKELASSARNSADYLLHMTTVRAPREL